MSIAQRHGVCFHCGHNHDAITFRAPQRGESATELESLRDENEALRAQQAECIGKSAKQQDEIERLRHALRTLLGETEDSDYMTGAEQKQMAREALTPNVGGNMPAAGTTEAKTTDAGCGRSG